MVAQMGARMYYAVARIFAKQGILCCLFTDFVSIKPPLSYLRMLPSAIISKYYGSLSRRMPQGIDKGLIKDFPIFGLKYALRRKNAKSPSDRTANHLWAGQTFTTLVNKHAQWNDVTAVYAFNSAALELFVEAKRRGKKTILEQTIAPRIVERELLSKEKLKWPDWSEQNSEDINEQDFCEREQAEWEVADVIICGSQFVKDGITKCDSNLSCKCKVVPYGYDAKKNIKSEQRIKNTKNDKLHILTAGTVGLRKGTPYVIEAAKKLSRFAEFKLAGTIDAPVSLLNNLPVNVNILGHVSKQEMISLYSWADIFLLPSICEGSATVTYEALAMSVPVICTPNTGSVIRDGIDGYIIRVASSQAICEKLIELYDNPSLLKLMSCQALKRSREFSIAAYGNRLLNALI